MKHIRLFKFAVILLMITLIAAQYITVPTAQASDQKVGIAIADKSGNYTFYDLNDSSKSKEVIETTADGNVMVPLKSVVKLMPTLTYRYDTAKKQATVTNSYNSKKIVYTMDSKYLNYYSNSKAKAVKQAMSYPMYISKSTSAIMVPMSSLKWALQSTGGYHFYSVKEMQAAGYDTYSYNGLILYQPYKSITTLPKAATVKGISPTVKVTIPEGYSVAQTFDLLVKKGVCSSTAGLYKEMASYDFTYYPLVKEIKADKNRCFKLEGYLYPDTYEFYRLTKPQDVIGKFLRNTEAKITSQYRSRAKELGYSMDQVLTIASIIEKETPDSNMMPTIASVLYNRLNVKMKIQCDSSIYYVERYIKPYISGDINRYNSYYNTYKCPALPAGPICNPGSAAIKAALYPKSTDFLYFYSDDQGVYHFSHDYQNPNNISTGGTDQSGGTNSAGSSGNTPSISPTPTESTGNSTGVSLTPTVSTVSTPTIGNSVATGVNNPATN